MKRQFGFTLIEALVTLAIAAVLASMAIPGFKTIIQNDRLVTQSNDLVAALTYARSEAIAQNNYATVCASADETTCSGSATGWGSGWIICVQQNGGTALNCTGTGLVLQVHGALAGNNTSANSAGLAHITFTSTGTMVESAAAINIDVCDSRGNNFGRSLYIYSAGQVRSSPTVGKRLDGSSVALC